MNVNVVQMEVLLHIDCYCKKVSLISHFSAT
jgi:hypothetical protein